MNEPIKRNISKSKKKIGAVIDAVLLHTHHHYLSTLPEKLGVLPTFFLKALFSGIKINRDPSITKKIPKDCIIIYATKYKSNFEYLFSHERFKKDDLPCPEVGFDYKLVLIQPLTHILRLILARIDYFFCHFAFPDPYQSGYYKNRLLNGKAGLISLIYKKDSHVKFIHPQKDPIQYLIEIQQTINQPIIIIPQLFFFSREPHRSELNLIDILFGTKEKPGKIRRIVALFTSHKKIFVEIAEPLNLKQYLELPEVQKRDIRQQALALRRRLVFQINRHRQSIIGPTLKSRVELKQNILTGKQLQSVMADHAEKSSTPLSQVYKQADEYLEEIAANYSQAWIRIYDLTLRSILKTMFEGIIIDQEGLRKVKQMSKKGPLILVPCHKSHLDYLVLSFVFYHNNIACPHIAAGKNLSFWPLGTIFRGGGAFFIRRTFKGAVLYSKIFSAYIRKLLEEGFNIEVFIEGGRSRTGKLLPPKLGLLSIILNAFREGACEDLIFVPVYIGYDKVLEEAAYLHEIEGGQKKPEDLKQVIRARKFLKNRYGKIYIKFDEPLSLKDQLAKNKTDISNMAQKEFNGLIRYLGYKLINAIDNVSVVTPYGLVAGAILNCSKTRFSHDHLKSHLKTYMNYLVFAKAKLADTLIADQDRAFDLVLDTFIQRRFLENNTMDMGGENATVQYKVNEHKRPSLEYYKNNCISPFVSAAFTALSILERDAFLFSTRDLFDCYTFLSGFFINEFSHNADKPVEICIRKSIKAFIDDAILIPHPTLPDTYNVTSAGFRKLQFFSNFLKSYFESYWIVLNYFMQTPRDDTTTKERIKKIQSIGTKMYKNKEVERIEALSKIGYKNADQLFTGKGIRGSEDKDKIAFHADAIQKYLNYFPS